MASQSASSSSTVDSSQFECAVCLNLLSEPVTIACGHTFCRTCLTASLTRSQRKCPMCRAPCLLDAQTHPENVLVSNVLRAAFPETYASRLADSVKARESWKRTLPIFFFNDALVPTAPLNLHLFEMRYRIMIRRIMESSRQFLYLPNFTDYQPHVGDIGLIAQVSECEVLQDGRAYLASRLRTRVRIVEHWCEEGTHGLYYCTVEDVRDAPLSDDERRRARDTLSSLLEALASTTSADDLATIKQEFGEPPLQDLEALSFWLAGALRIPSQDRYASLLTTSMTDRLAILSRHRPAQRSRWSLSSMLGRWATEEDQTHTQG